MFEKILIANRGEIALRVLRACREMGIKTVAVHSTADSEAMHVRLADETVCIGPPPGRDSYLNKAAVISAAMITNAEAIHPGYGFLSENAEFADMVKDHGLTFIGPSAEHIRIMGDKVQAKLTAKKLGIPVVPGSDGAVKNEDDAVIIAEEIGYPVLIKATAGGGGRGMKVAQTKADLREAFKVASSEAEAAFGNGEVYMEKYLGHPRHIEIQVLGDQHGNVVHLGERDCSLQRKHQKIFEECPSPALNPKQRDEIGKTVTTALKKIGYHNAGTVEFLYEDGKFYFIEMNTRLQVEHPITEMITGLDLVREQIRVAAGLELGFGQKDVEFQGCAMECRINAEDPRTFAPSPGTITGYHSPGGRRVRVDSAMYAGSKIPPYYDSLISKLIVQGTTRNECIMRMRRALHEYVIDGIKTTIPLHQAVLDQQAIIDGNYDIRWLERFVADWVKEVPNKG
jgi:acetyl-CoA carboxylase, biotin carboxylase subunit